MSNSTAHVTEIQYARGSQRVSRAWDLVDSGARLKGVGAREVGTLGEQTPEVQASPNRPELFAHPILVSALASGSFALPRRAFRLPGGPAASNFGAFVLSFLCTRLGIWCIQQLWRVSAECSWYISASVWCIPDPAWYIRTVV